MSARPRVQRWKILKFLIQDENENIPFSPLKLSKRLSIPNSTARNELGELLRDGLVKQLINVGKKGHLDYYSNESILKAYIKKHKRKKQIADAQRKRRAILR